MHRSLQLFLFLLVFAAACSKDNDPTGPGSGGVTLVNGTFSGSVNGAAYLPQAVAIVSTGGIVSMGSADSQGRSLGWAVFASGPGTFNHTTSVGNNMSWVENSNTWQAASGISGTSFTVNLTTLTASRAVGSFTATLVPSQGSGGTGTRTLSGSFDITF